MCVFTPTEEVKAQTCLPARDRDGSKDSRPRIYGGSVLMIIRTIPVAHTPQYRTCILSPKVYKGISRYHLSVQREPFDSY